MGMFTDMHITNELDSSHLANILKTMAKLDFLIYAEIVSKIDIFSLSQANVLRIWEDE